MKTILIIFFIFFTITSCEFESGGSECYLNNTGSIKFINNDTIVHTFYIFNSNLIPIDTVILDTSQYYTIDLLVGDYLLKGVEPYDSNLNVINCSGYTYKFPIK
jgi:hypothetical protein